MAKAASLVFEPKPGHEYAPGTSTGINGEPTTNSIIASRREVLTRVNRHLEGDKQILILDGDRYLWVDLRQQREIDALTARTRQLRIEQEKLQRLATIDELTGVLNRRGLEQAMGDFEAAALGMTLVMLDIDHFKHVNDRHGHDCGDLVLQRVAAVVAGNLRGSDVFGRWGGEEFLIVCQGTRVRDGARLAEKLRELDS